MLAASTEIGQGTNTIFAQIAADALGIDSTTSTSRSPTPSTCPNSGPTVASRTCMVVGKLVESAALGLRRTLVDAGYLPARRLAATSAPRAARYVERVRLAARVGQYQPPPDVHWDDERYQGDAYGAYAWAVYVAEVTVDTRTCETRSTTSSRVQEVGKVIHPVLAAGQIEGGVAQGIGWALYEDVVWREGRMANAQMTNYIMPTSMDLPPIRVYFEEVAVRARARRRQGHRRAADGRPRAGDRQRGRARDGRRRHAHPADAGAR